MQSPLKKDCKSMHFLITYKNFNIFFSREIKLQSLHLFLMLADLFPQCFTALIYSIFKKS